MFSRTAFRKFQHFSTEGMFTLSSGECGLMIVGPHETLSRRGYAPLSIPHSRPAWMAITAGSFPYSSAYTAFIVCSIVEELSGAHPGYPPSKATVPQASSTTALIRSASSSLADSTELRIRVLMTNFPFSVLTMAVLLEVSTSPGIWLLILSTPSGQASRA